MSREYVFTEEEYQGEGVIVDELLNGLSDWRSVPDIVRLTFKALSDVVKSHTNSIHDLEIQLSTKASRSELVQKANLTDLNRAFSDARSGNQDFKSLETIHSLLEEKATRKECQYLISGKFNEIKSELDQKVNSREMQSEIRALRNLIEDASFKKSQNKDLDNLYKLIEEKATIADVNAALDEKVNKQAISSALHKKVGKADVEALLLSKADLSELQGMFAMLENKAEKHVVDAMMRELSQKADKADLYKATREEPGRKGEMTEVGRVKRDFEYKLSQFDKYLETLRVSIEQTQATLSEEIAHKISGGDSEFKTEITRISSSFKSDLKKSEEKMQRLDSGIKAIYEEFGEIKSKLSGIVGKLEDRERVPRCSESAFESFRQEIRLIYTKDLEKVIRDVSTSKSFLEKYIDSKYKELSDLISERPNKFELNTLINDSKLHRVYLEEADSLKKSIESLSKRNFTELYEALDSLRSDLLQKANSQDIMMLLKSKPDISQLNELVFSLVKSSEDKQIIEALCGENCIGRWLWKSGEIRAGYSVPWEIQSVNTCPENFVWEKDAVSIVTITPGLYEIFFGFFTGKKPAVQLLINGEAVIVDTGSENKLWGRHRDGNIVGSTLIDYIALPARARVCLTYSGPRIVEGFLSLRKL